MAKKQQHPIPGKRHTPARKYRYRVNVPGFAHMGFSKVSGLSSETAVTPYREGDEPPTDRKLAGRTSFENIVLERGAGPDSDFKIWREEVFSLNVGSGLDEDETRRHVVIQLLDNRGIAVIREWTVPESWATKDEYDDLDASSDDVELERLTLAHNGWERTI